MCGHWWYKPGGKAPHAGEVDLQVHLVVACVARAGQRCPHNFCECVSQAVLIRQLLIGPLGIHLSREA